MIKKFNCNNFRNISCDDLEFDKINILIGANNAGKSNFIRALSFAANMVSNAPSENSGFLSEIKRNGWSAALKKNSEIPEFQFSWDLELPKAGEVVYTLNAHVGKRREENYIAEEALNGAHSGSGYAAPYNFFRCHDEKIGRGAFSSAGMAAKKNKLINAEVDPYESVLLQMDKLFFENKTMFSAPFVRDNIRDVLDTMRTYFRGFFSYACTTFHITAIREMQDEQADGSFLKKDGSNFVNVYDTAMQKDSDFEKRYLAMLKELIPECNDVKVCHIAGKIWMELKIRDNYFPLSEVSDGTVHLLLILLLLNLPEADGVSMLAIDEPEMNLHPAWQKMLANEIMRCNSFKQCFISTHSPDFLDEFTEEFLAGEVGVFVFDPYSMKSIRKLDRHALADDLIEWTLGDLYRIGDPVIGGWPQ